VFAFLVFGLFLSWRPPSTSPVFGDTNIQPCLYLSLCTDIQVNDTSCAPRPVFGDNIKPVGGTKSRRIFVGPNHGAAFWYSFHGSTFTQDVAGCVIGGVEKKRPASDFMETQQFVLDPVMEEKEEEDQVNEDVIQFDDDGDVVMTDAWEEENVVADGNAILCFYQDEHGVPDAPPSVDDEVPFVVVAGAPVMATAVSTPSAPHTALNLLSIPAVAVPIFTSVPGSALSVAPALVALDDDGDAIMTDAWEDENVVDGNTMACLCYEDEVPALDSVLAHVVPSATILAGPAAVPTVVAVTVLPHPGPPAAVTAQGSVTSLVEVALAKNLVPDSALSTAAAAHGASGIPSRTTLACWSAPPVAVSAPAIPPPTELDLLLAAAPSPVIKSPTNLAVGAGSTAGAVSPVHDPAPPQATVTANNRLSDIVVEVAPRSMHKLAANGVSRHPPVTAVLRRSARLAAKHACHSCLGTTFINGRRRSARLASRTS
jgi:hypothetical protein